MRFLNGRCCQRIHNFLLFRLFQNLALQWVRLCITPTDDVVVVVDVVFSLRRSFVRSFIRPTMEIVAIHEQPLFRLFTKESISKIQKKAEETQRLAKERNCAKQRSLVSINGPASDTAAAAAAATEAGGGEACAEAGVGARGGGGLGWGERGAGAHSGETPADDVNEPPCPNPALEAGRHLPSKLGEFPPELYGKPIEELDEFYQDKYVRHLKDHTY